MDPHKMFSNRTLNYFLELSDTMNYTKAAEKLGITQPALTQQIKKLEKITGAPLFYTTGKKMHLTEVGKSVLRMTHGIYTILESTSEEIQKTTSAKQGSIKIGLLSSLEDKIFTDLIIQHKKISPEIQISLYMLTREEIWNKLENNFLDLAIMYLPDYTIKNWNAYGIKEIAEDELLFIHGKEEWTNKKTIEIEETAAEVWTLYPDTYYINDWLKKEFHKHMLDMPTVSAYLSTPTQLYQYSQKTNSVTALPKSFVDANHLQDSLSAFSFADPIFFKLAFVYRKDKVLIPRIEAFLDFFEVYNEEQDYFKRLNNIE
ncbi:LysR family transcriptional regulator [Lacticigenium naphthae]|uniref:LysR family transcriptional regulator n=1 Tax=Lacticigenium naphthae TaxID=515351 RepID=UPI00042513DC|nr:LysR family transcriptional regulator [Lacticigenium naphthae]